MPNNYLDEYKGAYDDTFRYALDNRLIMNWYPERIMQRASGDSLLELGVGHGFCSASLTRHFKRHVIVEGSSAIIADFRKRPGLDNIEIVHTFFEEYTAREKFDVIVMGFVLEHVDDPAGILNRFKEYLCPGGSIFITVPNAHALNKRIGFEAGMIKDYLALSEGDLALGHKRLFTVGSLRALIEGEGLTVRSMEGLFLKPITTDQILKLEMSEAVLQAMMRVGVEYPELCVGIMAEAGAGR